jgi:hypothetical protein
MCLYDSFVDTLCQEYENWTEDTGFYFDLDYEPSGSCSTGFLDELNKNSQARPCGVSYCRVPPSSAPNARGARTLPRAAHSVLQKLGHGPEQQLDLPGLRGLP